jgi:hypothetical protein
VGKNLKDTAIDKAGQRPAESIAGFITAVFLLLTAFGVSLSDVQVAAVLSVIGATPAVVTLVVNRRRRRLGQ